VNVEFDSSSVWGIKKVDKQLIRYLKEDFWLIELYGRQQDLQTGSGAFSPALNAPGPSGQRDPELDAAIHMWKKRAERSELKLVHISLPL